MNGKGMVGTVIVLAGPARAFKCTRLMSPPFFITKLGDIRGTSTRN